MSVQITRRLPGGYGDRQGDEAYINGSESLFQRNELQQSPGGWGFSTIGSSLYSPTSSVHFEFAQEQRLYLIPDRRDIVLAKAIRLYVTAPVAASTVQTALYMWDISDRKFRQLPGSKAIFNTTSMGLKTVQLAKPVEILPSMRLFLGIWISSNTVELQGLDTSFGLVARPRSPATITTATPLAMSYALETTVANASFSGVPIVTYLSRDASLVL